MRAYPLILITLLSRVNCFPLSPTTSIPGRWGHICTVTRNSKQPIESSPQFEPVKRVVASAGAALATFFLSVSLGAEPTFAADGAAIGKCLLKSCQVELARCVTDPLCAKNLICIQGCNGRPDEQACQIRCGDLNDNSVIGNFNRCAVTQKQCVPQREDDGSYPIPTEGLCFFSLIIIDSRYWALGFDMLCYQCLSVKILTVWDYQMQSSRNSRRHPSKAAGTSLPDIIRFLMHSLARCQIWFIL